MLCFGAWSFLGCFCCGGFSDIADLRLVLVALLDLLVFPVLGGVV